MNADPTPFSDADLIAAAKEEAEELGTPVSGIGVVVPPPGIDQMKDSFPGYQLTREIQRGGQGVVYQAIHKGTKKKVAIKVMREGPFAGARDRARFEREMHILAQLNDPHIVQIHDAGSVGGCHYYVMDYISGHALDFYMASRPWPVRETLALFQKICVAVNASHLRGVIHRDLKPGNIRIDIQGEPHILDFGLAKVVTGEITGDSQPRLMSMTGEFIGSLRWASPEQVEGIASKIDIRTDVYSLGVVLFQMLTATSPYPVDGTMRSVMDNILTAIPIRPRSIRREIDDEVETIVLKCLSKERDRRYQTAGELARDVGHYLSGEPIEAKRDSARYVLRKALGRYRLAVAVAAGFAVVLTVGFFTSYVYWRRAEAQKIRAVAAELRARLNLEFFQAMIGEANPEMESKPDITVLQVLERAAKKLSQGGIASGPDRVEFQTTVATTYRSLEHYEQSKPHYEAALEGARQYGDELKPSQVECLFGLSTYYTQKGKDYAVALAYGDEMLAAALSYYGPIHPMVARSYNNLGVVYFKLLKLETAEAMFRRALTMRRDLLGDHKETGQTLNNLAVLFRSTSRFDEAIPLYREALTMFERVSGAESYDVARVLGSFGQCLREAKQYPEAEQLLQQAIRLKRKVHSSESSIANTEYQLALLYGRQQPRDVEAAVVFCLRALERRWTGDERDQAEESLQLLWELLGPNPLPAP